jgi:hypothetical protein
LSDLEIKKCQNKKRENSAENKQKLKRIEFEFMTQIWRELIFTELGLALVADQWVPAPRRRARVADQKGCFNQALTGDRTWVARV